MTEQPTRQRSRSITALARKRGGGASTVLSMLVLAYQVRWRSVEERLHTHGEEAAVLDAGGYSVLYKALVRREGDYPPFPIVRAILRAYPRAIWERRQNTTLLELAVRRMASLETLELLCQARPSIPEDCTALASLWTAYCRCYGSEEQFVDILASETSMAHDIGRKFQLLLKYLTTEQLLPCTIHTAASSSKCPLNLFKFICAELSHQIMDDEVSPLYLALDGIASRTDRADQLAKFLHLVKVEDLFFKSSAPSGLERSLPVHIALDAGVYEEEFYSSLAERKEVKSTLAIPFEKNGLFPFEVAACAGLSTSIIYELLRPAMGGILTPERISRRRTFRKPPKALKLQRTPQWMSPDLKSLVQSVPPASWDDLQQTLRTPVDPKWHQLIGAAGVFGCPLRLMKLLIDMHPEKLLHEDKDGWLPLHHAIMAQQGFDQDIILMLLDSCPEATRHRDRHGFLPLHLAVLSGKAEDLLDRLFCLYPKAMTECASAPGLPPALLAAHCRRSTVSETYFLLSRSLELFNNSTFC